MYKLIALYGNPVDPVAFDSHYAKVHTPLVQRVPGLAKLVLNRRVPPPWGGASEFYLIAELHFADEGSFTAAMTSAEMRAVSKDVRNFAADILTLATVRES
jgi:uncharacterized protein (TIGR02118 family)